jgi:hypothetical protein
MRVSAVSEGNVQPVRGEKVLAENVLLERISLPAEKDLPAENVLGGSERSWRSRTFWLRTFFRTVTR